MKGLIVFLCVGLLVGPGLAEASQAGRRAAAERLLQATHMRETLDRTIVRMTDMQIRNNPQLAPLRDVMLKFERKYIGYDSLKSQLVGLYASNFTKKELDDITAFYGTPTGRKAIRLMPKLAAEGAQIGIRRMRAHQGELRSMLEARIKELKKEGADAKNK